MPQPTQAVSMFFDHVENLADLNSKRKELLLKLHPDKNVRNSTAFIQMQAEYERTHTIIQNRSRTPGNNNIRWKTGSCLFKETGQGAFECRCGEKIVISVQDTECVYECPTCSLCHDVSCA
jgi:hypothetical protein